MKLSYCLPLVALLANPSAPGSDSAAVEPTWAERLAFNPHERTRRGLAERERERPAEAAAALESALRLAPVDPLARFNAGTARLEAGIEGAAELLERAAEDAPAELAPAVHFNLGNARVAGRDLQGALEAYREALRRQPDHAAAKHNLELALRELERQQQQEQQQQEQQQQEQQQERPAPDQPQGSPGADEPQESPSEGGEAEGGEPRPDAPSGQRPRPQFQEQPDMTAEQAAAILQSVENLERQQRRDQASERAQSRAKVAKDW